MSPQQPPANTENIHSDISSRTLIIRWFGTLLTLALLVYLLTQVGWGDIIQALRQIALWRFIMAFFLMLISRIAVSARWHTLLNSVEIKITPLQTLKITFAGFFASNFLPTTIGGDVVRLGGIIQLDADKAVSLASLIVDRLIGMAGMASALPLGIPVLTKYLQFPLLESMNKHLLHYSSAFAPLGSLSSLLESGKKAVQRLFSALLLWRTLPGSLTSAFAFTWIHQLSLYAQIWLLLTGMGDSLPIWSIAGLWSATYFVTLLPVSINGMGMQELSATFFFTTVGGVSLEHSLTVAILIRSIQALVSLPGALYVPKMVSGESRLP